ncbi:hypothetical protein CALVIDRAFT_562207 [Calocera viscosa TUFC12733]|uniref:Uncharacterized protein n=1 Tax=Calocera viscosa (strain TUFC12733) TaxID=1330018 RepID=A0A167P0C5_CALVF|nr:hypothetical protein CALVIDRAFT_562207 [Calocera viscosa TUFC12733]
MALFDRQEVRKGKGKMNENQDPGLPVNITAGARLGPGHRPRPHAKVHWSQDVFRAPRFLDPKNHSVVSDHSYHGWADPTIDSTQEFAYDLDDSISNIATFGSAFQFEQLAELLAGTEPNLQHPPHSTPKRTSPRPNLINGPSSPSLLHETPADDFNNFSFSSTSSISPLQSEGASLLLGLSDQAFYGSANEIAPTQLASAWNQHTGNTVAASDLQSHGIDRVDDGDAGRQDNGSHEGSRPPDDPARPPSRSRSPSDHGPPFKTDDRGVDTDASDDEDDEEPIEDIEEQWIFEALQDGLQATSGSADAQDRRQRAKTLLSSYYRKIWPKAPGALPESAKLGRRVAKALIQAIVDEIAQHYHIHPARVWKDVGVFTGYARSSNAWNLYQKRARVEREPGARYDAAMTRREYLERGADNPDLQLELEEWNLQQPLQDGDQLRPSERQQIFNQLVASAKYVFSNYDSKSQIGGRIQVAGLNPLDDGPMYYVWESEGLRGMGSSISGWAEDGDRVLMKQWVANKYGPLMVNPPADDSIDPRGHQGTRPPGVREMKEAIKARGKILLHDAMRLAKPNAKPPLFNRWGPHIEEAMIQHQCTLVNWPNDGPFPHDLQHELQNTPHDELFPIWIAYTTEVPKLKVSIRRWAKDAIKTPLDVNPPLIIRVDGSTWSYNDEIARYESLPPPSRPPAITLRDRRRVPLRAQSSVGPSRSKRSEKARPF